MDLVDLTTYKTSEDVRETFIGDQKAVTFEPAIEISPWEDSEDCLKIYKDTSLSSNVITDLRDSESLIWQDETERWQIEPFGKYIPKGIRDAYYSWTGAQFIIRVDERPKAGRDGWVRFPFKMSGHKNMNFHLQPGAGHPLWKAEFAEGTPDWAEWSIAVYHKTKRNSSPGHNYKTGKVCHILRPWAVDSEGNFTWGRWEIGPDTITKLIPASVFETGTHWLVDATFGNTSQGGSTTNQIDNSIWATNENESPAANGTVDTLHAWLYASSITARNMKMALYDDSDQSLIANSGSDEINSGTDLDGDISFGYSGTAPSILAASQYHIAIWGAGQAGDVEVYDDYVVTASINDAETYGSWPDPIDNSSVIPRRISVYVEYTAGGGSNMPLGPLTGIFGGPFAGPFG